MYVCVCGHPLPLKIPQEEYTGSLFQKFHFSVNCEGWFVKFFELLLD